VVLIFFSPHRSFCGLVKFYENGSLVVIGNQSLLIMTYIETRVLGLSVYVSVCYYTVGHTHLTSFIAGRHFVFIDSIEMGSNGNVNANDDKSETT
jgi:hypothetical protein